jgi:hypothetical protein
MSRGIDSRPALTEMVVTEITATTEIVVKTISNSLEVTSRV